MSTVYHRPADPSGDDSYVRPLFADRCQAGFPSPATDYAEQELDLNSYCISRPAATFFLRTSGESMNQAGVQNGDLLVVDRAENHNTGTSLSLRSTVSSPSNDCCCAHARHWSRFQTARSSAHCIRKHLYFGIVTHVIHRTRELR